MISRPIIFSKKSGESGSTWDAMHGMRHDALFCFQTKGSKLYLSYFPHHHSPPWSSPLSFYLAVIFRKKWVFRSYVVHVVNWPAPRSRPFSLVHCPFLHASNPSWKKTRISPSLGEAKRSMVLLASPRLQNCFLTSGLHSDWKPEFEFCCFSRTMKHSRREGIWRNYYWVKAEVLKKIAGPLVSSL